MTRQRLEALLGRIDRRGYAAYRDLLGAYDLGGFTLVVDRVQPDPFAPPSLLRARTDDNRFDPALVADPIRRVGFEDFLLRRVDAALGGGPRGGRGPDRGGEIEVQHPSQKVLPRTAVVVAPGFVELRLAVGLPGHGRSVDARAARAIFFEALPALVGQALTPAGVDQDQARRHVEAVEDAVHLRGLLPGLGLVAFVADGAVLPRESGASDRPLRQGAVPFTSPPELRVAVELPNRGRVAGMGIPEGVTLIAGGGFHGKSTLLAALAWGVYDHARGDGRELVVTRPDAVTIRAEDGRAVAGVDISTMINDLPGDRSTVDFSTPNASGSTSQAANIAEALGVGTSLLLVDEDTSATNFMVRDERMRELVRREPITPFLDLVGPLHRERAVSTIVVVGGVGDYLDVADRVILLEEYRAADATDRARRVRDRFPGRSQPAERPFPPPRRRRLTTPIDLQRGRRTTARGRGRGAVELGEERVDLGLVEQIAEAGQTEAIARLLGEFAAGGAHRDLRELVDHAIATVQRDGLDALGRGPGHPGELSLPRRHELAAALNRLRSLRATATGAPN